MAVSPCLNVLVLHSSWPSGNIFRINFHQPSTTNPHFLFPFFPPRCLSCLLLSPPTTKWTPQWTFFPAVGRQALGGWKTSAVTGMSGMFARALRFNQAGRYRAWALAAFARHHDLIGTINSPCRFNLECSARMYRVHFFNIPFQLTRPIQHGRFGRQDRG